MAGHTLQASSGMMEYFKGKVGGFQLLVNGKPLETKNPPFILEEKGVTMVPLRDLAEALGCDLQWDDTSRTILISNDGRNTVYGPAVKIDAMRVIRNVGPFYRDRAGYYQIAGRRYSEGIAADLTKESPNAEFVLDLDGNYLTLEGCFGVDDETMNSLGFFILTILGDERVLYASSAIKPSTYANFIRAGDLDLAFVQRLTFRVKWEESEIGEYEDLKMVLADFKFYKKL